MDFFEKAQRATSNEERESHLQMAIANHDWDDELFTGDGAVDDPQPSLVDYEEIEEGGLEVTVEVDWNCELASGGCPDITRSEARQTIVKFTIQDGHIFDRESEEVDIANDSGNDYY